MTADPLDKIRNALLTGVAAEPRRSQRRRVVAAVVAAVVLISGGGLVLASPWDDATDATDDAVIAGEGTEPADPPGSTDTSGRTLAAGESVWAVEQPSGWHRAGRELMPHLGWDSLTLATVPLRQGGERCAQMPEQALRDMTDDDALVSIFFDVPQAEDSEPTGFTRSDLELLENSDAAECAERGDLEVHWGHRGRSGVSFYILVVFGADVPDDLRETTWETLESFRPVRVTYPTRTRPCTVTLPPTEQPDLPLPVDPDLVEDVIGPGQSWVGTADLWTALPDLGTHVPRKSIWWSQHFPGGSVEPRPPLRVTWERLDAEVPPIVAEAPGTNGPSPDSGFFMLNGIDPDEPGCWKVTAAYKGHELSYVYWNPPDQPGSDGSATCAVDGPATLTVPDVIGMTLDRAIDSAIAAGLEVVGTGTPRGDPTAADATVIAQEPPAGTRVPPRSCLGFRTAIAAEGAPTGPHVGAEDESAKDLAERFMRDVIGDPSIAVSAHDADRRTTVVRLETSTGAVVDATVVASPVLRRHVLGDLRSPGLAFDEVDGPTVTVPEPGTLSIRGYDGEFTSPGEVMIHGRQATQPGAIGPLDLVESSWLRIDLEVADGRVLHLVQMRA